MIFSLKQFLEIDTGMVRLIRACFFAAEPVKTEFAGACRLNSQQCNALIYKTLHKLDNLRLLREFS